MDPQATALLLCVREVAAMMEKGRRILAVTYAGGAASSRCGSSSSRSARRMHERPMLFEPMPIAL